MNLILLTISIINFGQLNVEKVKFYPVPSIERILHFKCESIPRKASETTRRNQCWVS